MTRNSIIELMSCEDINNINWTDMYLRTPECINDVKSHLETMIVHQNGDCYRGDNYIGVTDPRRIEEIGEHLIYNDGQVVGSFHTYDFAPEHFALAE